MIRSPGENLEEHLVAAEASVSLFATLPDPPLSVFFDGFDPLPVPEDPSGNRQFQSETNAGRTETTSYTYDFVNRLETVTYEDGTANAKTTTYTYDLAGNRLTEQEIEVATSNVVKDLVYDYDEINRLETITDNLDAAQNVAYSYDANGNTLSKTKDNVTTTFKYDIRDQLGEVLQGASVLGRYGYDYDGRRILKIGDDGRIHYTYDQLSVITEASDTNITVSKYDYGLDQLVSLNNQVEGRSFFHLDVLRSTVSLTDGGGSTRQSILYDAWGNERERVGSSASKFTFTGHELDEETLLVYAKSRFYDTRIGRFIGQDSYIGVSNIPQSLHRYVYARTNPLKFVDEDGRDVRLANETREGRKKALDTITVNLRVVEQRNIRYRKMEDDTYKIDLRDPNKIDPEKASPGYRYLSQLVQDEGLEIDYVVVEEEKSYTARDYQSYSHRDLAGIGPAEGGTIGGGLNIYLGQDASGNLEIDVLVPEGGYVPGVWGLTESGKDVPIEFHENIIGAHELLGETYKYTRGKESLQQDKYADSDKVIEIENEIRKFHGLPLRSGKGHGFVSETITVKPKEDKKQEK